MSSYADAILQTMREPLLVLDRELRVVSAAPAFFRAFGGSEGEAIGRSLFELDAAAWDTPALRDALQRLLPEHRELRDLELTVELPAGTKEVVLNAREVEMQGESFGRILVAVEDVTEARRAARETARAHQELLRSNRELEEFAHGASHDLQEPLRKIHTYVHRLVAALPAEALTEQAAADVTRVTEAVARLRSRIDDLLALARVSRAEPKFAAVNLKEVVERVLRDSTLEDAVVSVGDLPTVEADPTQMELLLQNLLSNALKYRRKDAEHRVEVSSTPTEPPAGDPRAWVKLTVQDNGIGFEDQYAERIFGAFQRLHGRSEYEGNGIGLALCRRVAEKHGATIVASGELGVGARFDLRLPTTQAPSQERGP